MQLSQQAQALAAAGTIASLMASLRSAQNAANAFLTIYNDQSYDAILQALPTFSFNPNGSQGAYDQSAGSGTVSVIGGSPALVFSASQSGLAGQYIVIGGDPSNGLYLVATGSGANWNLASNFGGAVNPAATWATAVPNNAHPIGLPAGNPLNMARNNLLTAVGCLTNFATFMVGGAVSAQANTPQKFADLLNS